MKQLTGGRERLVAMSLNFRGRVEGWIHDFAHDLEGLEEREFVVINRSEVRAENGMGINLLAVGWANMIEGELTPWDQLEDGPMATLRVRFARGDDQTGEGRRFNQMVSEGEPDRYQVLFGREGQEMVLRQVQRLVKTSEFSEWQECDDETAALVVSTIGEILFRFGQMGE